MSKAPIEATIKQDKRKKKEKVLDGQMNIGFDWNGWWQDGNGKPPPNYPIPPENGDNYENIDGDLLVEKKETCSQIEAEHMENRTPDYTSLFDCPEPPLEAEESKSIKNKKKQLENLNEIQNRE